MSSAWRVVLFSLLTVRSLSLQPKSAALEMQSVGKDDLGAVAEEEGLLSGGRSPKDDDKLTPLATVEGRPTRAKKKKKKRKGAENARNLAVAGVPASPGSGVCSSAFLPGLLNSNVTHTVDTGTESEDQSMRPAARSPFQLFFIFSPLCAFGTNWQIKVFVTQPCGVQR